MLLPKGFQPVYPQADNSYLAHNCERLMIVFPIDWAKIPNLPVDAKIIDEDCIHKGWVIGVRFKTP